MARGRGETREAAYRRTRAQDLQNLFKLRKDPILGEEAGGYGQKAEEGPPTPPAPPPRKGMPREGQEGPQKRHVPRDMAVKPVRQRTPGGPVKRGPGGVQASPRDEQLGRAGGRRSA